MGFIIAIVFIWALWDVGKTAVRQAGSDYRGSRERAVREGRQSAGGELPSSRERSLRRRHATGYWAREALHGFPAARLGWHAGWLAHRTAHDQQRAIRDEAHTTHVETRADRLRDAREHRERRQRAQEEIASLIADDPAPERPVRDRVRMVQDELARRRQDREAAREVLERSQEADRIRVRDHADRVLGTSPGPGPYAEPAPEVRDDARPDDSSWLRPGDRRCEGCGGSGQWQGYTCPACRGWGAAPNDPDAPEAEQGAVCHACGNGPSPDDPVLADGASRIHRSHVLAAQAPYQDTVRRMRNPRTAPDPPASNGQASPSPATTGGTAVATGTAETTYDQSTELAKAHAQTAEADTATISARKKELENMAEAMQAAEVDAGTLQAVSDQIDRYDAAEKAIAACQDGASAIVSSLQHGHQGLNEAHQSAPVAAANREFYAG